MRNVDPLMAAGKKDEKKPEKFDDEKPFDEIVKNMDVIKGMFTFYRKADENKIYLEITTNQFDKLFLFSGSVDASAGEKGACTRICATSPRLYSLRSGIS